MKKIEIKINGFDFLFDENSRKVYSGESDSVGTDFKFLTQNEKQQVLDFIKYRN